MSGKKSEQIKLYMVIGLAVVFVICAYFRFIRPKAEQGDDLVSTATPAVEHLELDHVPAETKKPHASVDHDFAVGEGMQTAIRDIFSPQAEPKKVENEPRDHKSRNAGATLTLAGTIVGGKKPIAIINDQFVRTGEWIGAFRVVRIGKKDVLLDSGDKMMALEIMKNE